MQEQINRLENEKLLLLDKFELFKRTVDTTKKQDSIKMQSVVALTSIELMSTIMLVMLKRYNAENEAHHFRTRLFFPTAERLNDSHSTIAWRRCSPLKSSHETDLLRFDLARPKRKCRKNMHVDRFSPINASKWPISGCARNAETLDGKRSWKRILWI